MRLSVVVLSLLLAHVSSVVISERRGVEPTQPPLRIADELIPQDVSIQLFSSLERTARLADITYCVGTTGISPPFSCASRCKEFPTLQLVTSWDTGVLLSDSCGYIAVDHGLDREEGGDRRHGPAIVVAFRGTYSITNTIIDLSTIPQEYVPYPSPDDDGKGGKPENRCGNCTVHAGFLASWANARKVVLPQLKAVRQKHPDFPVHLVGHSLGGAVAALAALEMKLALGWDSIRVTTFGEPMVGNSGFVAYLDRAFGLGEEMATSHNTGPAENRQYRRVTHVGDPVPLLPLEEWGFRPHGGEIYVNKSSLHPVLEDVQLCRGDKDPQCIAGSDGSVAMAGLDLPSRETRREFPGQEAPEALVSKDLIMRFKGVPARFKLWQLLFAHRDYFWRLGLCVPGGDPWDWGRDKCPGPPNDDL